MLGSKLPIVGMVIPPLIGNPWWVYKLLLLGWWPSPIIYTYIYIHGNHGCLDPGTNAWNIPTLLVPLCKGASCPPATHNWDVVRPVPGSEREKENLAALTLRETNIAPENWCLEDEFFLEIGLFQGLTLWVSNIDTLVAKKGQPPNISDFELSLPQPQIPFAKFRGVKKKEIPFFSGLRGKFVDIHLRCFLRNCIRCSGTFLFPTPRFPT